MTGSRYSRTISQFAPAASVGLEAAEHHYREVHTRFARRLLRAKPQVISYHTARAEAAYDLNGRWDARPTTFRYIFLRFEHGRSLEFTAQESDLLAQDHRRFLRELRGFSVDSVDVIDRFSGQTAVVSYVFEFDRRPEEPADEGHERLAATAAELVELSESALGLRRLTLSPVADEFRADPIDEPGQRPVRERLPHTERAGFIELHWDTREWAEDWLGEDPVRAVLTDPGWSQVRGHLVRLECGLDRT